MDNVGESARSSSGFRRRMQHPTMAGGSSAPMHTTEPDPTMAPELIWGTCRRQSLLAYFGEDIGPNCGNCDNCTNGMSIEKDLSKETFLLLSCIRSMGGRWGLNLPIDVLRGSHLDEHGSGRHRSQSWWKALGTILLNNEYLIESVHGTYRTISLSDKGRKIIEGNMQANTALFFKITPAMMDEEASDEPEQMVSEQSDYQYNDSFTDGENILYQLLLTIRAKLAQDNCTAPYAICGDQVLRMFTKLRPSTTDTMCLVDGVNTTFIKKYAVIFLHYIKQKSQEYDLPLDFFVQEDEEDEVIGIDETSIHDLEEQNYFTDGNEEHHLPDASETNDILNLIRNCSGLNFEEIMRSFPGSHVQNVMNSINALESEFEIYKKNGMYYPL